MRPPGSLDLPAQRPAEANRTLPRYIRGCSGRNGGWLKCRSPHLSVRTAFEAGREAVPDNHPCNGGELRSRLPDLSAPTAFQAVPATRPVNSPELAEGGWSRSACLATPPGFKAGPDTYPVRPPNLLPLFADRPRWRDVTA